MTDPQYLLDEPELSSRIEANWKRVGERRLRRRRVRSAMIVALGALVVVGILVATRPSAPVALELPSELTSDLTTADGSSIHVGPSTRIETIESSPTRVELWLRSGTARFDILPGGPRRWVVVTAHASVEVLGTSFTVRESAERAEVEVHRGLVLVRSWQLEQALVRLGAGERLAIGASMPVTAVEPAPEAHSAEQPSPEPAIAGAPRAPERSPAPPSARARRSAPSSEPLPEPPTLAASDRLRAEGRFVEAVEVLRRIESVDPSGQGPLAAFTRARLELEPLRQPERAAEAFERALTLGLPSSLVEDARAGRVRAWSEAGRLDRARVAAQEYLDHHPQGRWREEVTRWVTPP